MPSCSSILLSLPNPCLLQAFSGSGTPGPTPAPQPDWCRDVSRILRKIGKVATLVTTEQPPPRGIGSIITAYFFKAHTLGLTCPSHLRANASSKWLASASITQLSSGVLGSSRDPNHWWASARASMRREVTLPSTSSGPTRSSEVACRRAWNRVPDTEEERRHACVLLKHIRWVQSVQWCMSVLAKCRGPQHVGCFARQPLESTQQHS
jgi:hypothetical protein